MLPCFQPRHTLPLPSTLSRSNASFSAMLNLISDAFKSCLPRRIREPTGPFMVLFDMLLSIFVGQGACKTLIDKLPLETVGQSHPNTVVPVVRGDKCPICLGPYETGDSVRHLHCNHAFHAECVDMWLEKKSICPLCKTDAC